MVRYPDSLIHRKPLFHKYEMIQYQKRIGTIREIRGIFCGEYIYLIQLSNVFLDVREGQLRKIFFYMW